MVKYEGPLYKTANKEILRKSKNFSIQMTQEEFRILTHDKIKDLIEANLDRSPTEFALSVSSNGISVPLVSTQLKYLQKARKKLPSYFKARCIIPPLSYEQCSSEIAAQLKSFSGSRCLDLTMGLGVDATHFSQHFEEVIAVEQNPVLANIGRYNMQLLGISNIEIIAASAKEFLDSYSGPQFDLIYVDPARRDRQGKRVFLLSESQPRIDLIFDRMLQHGKQLLIKLSPLFDIQEAIRQLPQTHSIQIVSIGNDCKELLVHILNNRSEKFPTSEHSLQILTHRQNKTQSFLFPFQTSIKEVSQIPESSKYLLEPDVAFYKGRVIAELLVTYHPSLEGVWNDPMGFFFCLTPPSIDFPGRIWQIQEILPYKPKQLKKRFKVQKITRLNIIRRVFPFKTKEIQKQIGLAQGGEQYLICTLINGEKRAIMAKLHESM